jgi:hypothetical protein
MSGTHCSTPDCPLCQAGLRRDTPEPVPTSTAREVTPQPRARERRGDPYPLDAWEE